MYLAVLFFSALAALSLRLDDTLVWSGRPSYFIETDPIFTSADSFLYARYAREIKQGKYVVGSVDELKFFPDSEIDPERAPRRDLSRGPSWLAAAIAPPLGLSTEKFSFYFIPILSCLVFIPIGVLFWFQKRPAAGFLSAFVLATSFVYVTRTSIVRLDTDVLNLFFPFTIALFLYLYFFVKDERKFIFVGLAALFGILFHVWYGPSGVFSFAFLLSFSLTLLVERRFRLSKSDIFAVLAFALPQLWFLYQAPFEALHYLTTVIRKKPDLFSGFPNTATAVSELRPSSLGQIVASVLENRLLFFLGLIGSFVWIFRERRLSIILLPVFLIGLLTFTSGVRFGIYLAPFLAVGISELVYLVAEKVFSREASRHSFAMLTAVCLALAVFLSSESTRRFVAKPKTIAPIAKEIQSLKRTVPEKAAIWAPWFYGYLVEYWAERRVFVDGSTFQTPKAYYAERTLISDSQKEAYNTISFISEKGLKGLESELKKGKTPLSLQKEFRNGDFRLTKDVFWLLSADYVNRYHWISYFGTWDFEKKKGKHLTFLPLGACNRNKNLFLCSRGIIDLDRSVAISKGKEYSLRKVVYIDEKRRASSEELSGSDFILELASSELGNMAFVVDSETYRSNFNQMYVLRRYDSHYFELVKDKFPYVVLYQVKKR